MVRPHALLSLLACGCSLEGGALPGGRDDGSDGDADADADADTDTDTDGDGDRSACPELYDQDRLVVIDAEIAGEELAALEDEYANWSARLEAGLDIKPYHPLDGLRVDGEDVPDAMIRLKGNPCCSWAGQKMQFVISFNEVDPDARFGGLRKIALDAPLYEPTLLHDRLALSYLSDLGLPAGCANNAELRINGAVYGLYANVQHVDRELLERVFGDDAADGNLYKYDWTAQRWEKKTNEDDPDMSDLDDLYETVEVGELERILDVEEVLLESAAEAMMPDADGYWSGSINFLLYRHPERGWTVIPWDLDYTFDLWAVNADPILGHGNWSGLSAHLDAIFADPTWTDRWIDAFERASAAYDPAILVARVDEWAAQIEEAVAADPNKPFSMEDHHAAVGRLREFVGRRAAFVRSWIECTRGRGPGDADGDGAGVCAGDCDDGDPAVSPGTVELCDGVDQDCSGVADDTPECPDCFEAWIGDTRAMLCPRPRTWNDALAECEAQGGTLAMPGNDDEQWALAATVFGTAWDDWWIGATDQWSEGSFASPDGTPLDWTAWGESLPDGAEVENCAVLDLWLGGWWDDRWCEEAHATACRLP